jgi:hypothetical protein
MLSSRLMVAGAIVMVGTAVSGPVRANCDRSFPLTCLLSSDKTANAKSEAAPAHLRPASKPPARATKTSVRDRRHASRRNAHHVRMARAEPRAAPAPQARHVSAAARRFREFVNPRSIALNPIDELKPPQPDGSALTTNIALATSIADPADGPAPPAGFVPGDATFSQNEINTLDLAAPENVRPIKVGVADIAPDGVPAAAPARLDELRGALPPERAPVGPTWLQLIFVIWGGILTLATAIRLFVG